MESHQSINLSKVSALMVFSPPVRFSTGRFFATSWQI
jgi:hypothetical protein